MKRILQILFLLLALHSQSSCAAYEGSSLPISWSGVASSAIEKLWHMIISGASTYGITRVACAAWREYEYNKKYWDILRNGGTEYAELKDDYKDDKLFAKITGAFSRKLEASDIKLLYNCALGVMLMHGISSAVYYFDRVAHMDDVPGYTDGSAPAQERLAELTARYEDAYFSYYGSRAGTCKYEITQLKHELKALDQQEFSDNNYKIYGLHGQGMWARWLTRWLFSNTAYLINDDGTLNVPAIQALLDERAVLRARRREIVSAHIDAKRIELQGYIKSYLLEQCAPSHYSRYMGAGLAGLATILGSVYALAKVNTVI